MGVCFVGVSGDGGVIGVGGCYCEWVDGLWVFVWVYVEFGVLCVD